MTIKIERSNGKASEFSKKLIKLLVFQSFMVCSVSLYLCYLCIVTNYSGGLPFLVTLIGASVISTGADAWKYYSKAQAENTKGGIVYEKAMTDVDELT